VVGEPIAVSITTFALQVVTVTRTKFPVNAAFTRHLKIEIPLLPDNSKGSIAAKGGSETTQRFTAFLRERFLTRPRSSAGLSGRQADRS
jgi:hypothetical protein